MVNKKTLRNLLMASALVSLQACGGGGGGGGALIDTIKDTPRNLEKGLSSLTNKVNDAKDAAESEIKSLQTDLKNLSTLSEIVNVDNPTQLEYKAIKNFFTSMESLNSTLEDLKSRDRETFDNIMQLTVDGYSWRDLHYQLHGAYKLLVPYKELVTQIANEGKFDDKSSLYRQLENDNELNAILRMNDVQIEQALIAKGKNDTDITKFNDNVVVAQLEGADSIITNFTSLIRNFNNELSGNELSLQGQLSALTANYKDVNLAGNLLNSINDMQVIWLQTTSIINAQDPATKIQIYNSEEYKNARAAYLYLTNTVKPIIGKIIVGTQITSEELVKLNNQDIANNEYNSVKETTVKNEVEQVVGQLLTIESSVAIDSEVETITSESAPYTETTWTDSDESTTSIEGEPVITQTTEDITNTVDNGDGTVTTTVTRFTKTITTTPVTIKTIKTRTYTDRIYKDVTTTTTTTPRTKNIYTDGSEQIVNGTPISESTTAKTLVSTENREEAIIVTENTSNSTSEATDDGVVVSTTTTSTAYTDADPNLGTRTPGYSSTKTDYHTNEYLDRDADGNLQGWANGGKKQVKASDAYSRGWTGKGVTVAVADTGYDTDHSEFAGQIVATKDYTGTGMDDTHGHGTHVLGSMVAKKDGAGTHGVAFDSKAVVIKITNSNYANTSLAADGFSWAADQGASVGNISANSNYDVYFRNSLTQLADGTYKSTDDRYDYGAGNFYNMQTPDEWIAATSKDLIVVNSAGNQGLAVPANPGYFATAVDGNGDLVLGGKMLIVGAVDQNNNVASWSNKAGHICQVVVDNNCTDEYKVSDFYLLAPGWTYSTKNDGAYGTMAGTSMAAPYVAGGVALVRQMWPYMKGENVVELLTTTANKSISGYNENIHGAGVMDLEKATRPVGATGIPTTGRTTSSVSTVSLSSSGGSGSSLSALQNSTALSSVMIVDEFARDFYVDLTKGITVQDKRKYSDVQVAQYGASYLPFQQQYGNYEQGGQFPVFMEGLEFGLYTDKDGNGDWSTNISKKFKLSDKFSIKTTAGTMNEQDTWLGNYTDGALSVGKNNVTNFGQLGVEYVFDKNTFTFDMAQGYTDVNTKSNSLISSVDTLETQSMKLGFERKIDSATRWGITYSIPNRITKGGTNLNVPYATTLDGEVIYDNVKTDLSSTTPEKDIGVYFSHNGEGETDWKTSFSIEYRQNVAGVAGDNKIAPSLQVSKKFYGACMKLFGMMNKKPGCEKIRIEKEINKLAKKKGTEEKIAALKYQLLGVQKQIAHINGDKQTVAKLDKEIALGWKQ